MTGLCQIVGMGPGDPELLTLKAVRCLAEADVVAWFAARGKPGHARVIAGDHVTSAARTLRFDYPYTTGVSVDDPAYLEGMGRFYDDCAAQLSEALALGRRVVVLCEGDPFLYGSAMYLFDRLSPHHRCEVVPGITGMSGCWSAACLPMVHGDDILSVLPATLDGDRLAACLAQGDAHVIMKIGRNLPKVRDALRRAGREAQAIYVERGTQPEQLCLAMERAPDRAPYFSMILVPGRRRPR
ncbi:precorrin-2 C(20)-methyltransferase [Swaminathania salitolerans]|uniref:Precorrin-2 C(20)-methyltransferase n=1 Tax=Swaminathania salitolerans TaxID=182838 RepID=A0A511BLM0_9PROT|nr:precorrin-2 C(20)-methyltransferase [Swaminathania salitolerans]GBQ09391.1 precorrin-2 C20-methyltransferase [Swaminathania salitolerans LMG 21291]GEL00992.1 precorrin-2 C(20)-methyltransferase [Swaminathania salitolerans]